MCVAARARYQKMHSEAKLEDLVIYTTTQTHSLGTKAGLILGLDVRALEVKAEDEYALRGNTLKEALEADLARGKQPFVVRELHFRIWGVVWENADVLRGCSRYSWHNQLGRY